MSELWLWLRSDLGLKTKLSDWSTDSEVTAGILWCHG